MPRWLLPTLSEILALNDPTWMVQSCHASSDGDSDTLQRPAKRLALRRVRAEREWCGAVAALSGMLHEVVDRGTLVSNSAHPSHGLVLSGPLPVLSHADLVSQFSTWMLTADPLQLDAWMPLQLMPAGNKLTALPESPTAATLPLLPGDPLATEQFCLVMTDRFSLVMVLGETLTEEPAFMFSFMPEVVQQAWEAIRPRILLMRSHQVDYLDDLTLQFAPVVPDYQTVMRFSRLMLEHLPEPLEELESERKPVGPKREDPLPEVEKAAFTFTTTPLVEDKAPDLELLQAIAHEVRTPLTTIRTLTRSLLKRTDLSPDVLKRLSIIDRECSEQIDRFGLIFRAVELETSTRNTTMPLTRTSLTQVFQQSIPRWQQQASQRQLTLEVVLPQKMPTVVSDPTMLDQALTSLIERFTRSLPVGSHIRVEVMLAGSQLKVQLQSQPQVAQVRPATKDTVFKTPEDHRPLLKSLGQLLMFQPDTGSLSLNLAVTKNLFQALGGKLIVRQRPEQGEVMTVFLPLETNGPTIFDA